MKFLRSVLAPASILAVALLSGGWFLQKGVGQDQNVYFQARLFQEVLDHVADRFVDPVDPAALYDSAIEGLIDELGDPNTSFLHAADWANLRIRTEGEYGGVGLEIVERGGWITVVSPLPGTPGERAGIRAGDQIIEVDGVSTEGWDSERAVSVLRGRPGTTADVRIRRPGVERPIPFTLERAVIHVRSVPFAVAITPEIGYVPLRVFSETSEEELRSAIDSLRAAGTSKLVLDLRGNPGGLLDSGVALSNLFLERGSKVVETRGRTPDQNSVINASRQAVYPDLTMVILVDERSASASEIVAGALQDHDRALLVGTTSFGKGSVQTLYSLTGGNVLKLTTARWYTPSGRSIHRPPERERVAPPQDRALAVSGQWVEPPDLEGRETVQSFGGRTLYGGGGITPDVIVLPDTLTSDERRDVLQLYEAAGELNQAVFNFAVRFLQQNPGLSGDFRLSDANVEDFYGTLPSQGVDVERSVLEGASRFVRFQLEREIALRLGGDAVEFRRLRRADAALRRAVELLEGAASTAALLEAGQGSVSVGAGAAAASEELR